MIPLTAHRCHLCFIPSHTIPAGGSARFGAPNPSFRPPSIYTKGVTAAPFSLLAHVYDAIMADIDYEDWARFVLETVAAPAGGRVLDLGCGTGNSTFPFYARGFEVVGLDASADMLKVAREKLPPVRFVRANFTDFCLTEPFDLPFDLVVSMFDSLNNLLEPAHFLRAATRVYEHLVPGGFFMFDVNTTLGLKNLWEAGRAEGWAGEVYYRWEHSFDEVTGLARVEAYCESEKGPFVGGFTEVHFERPYDPLELLELLSQAGFKEVQVVTYPSGAAATEDDVRVWGVARRG